MFPSKHYDTTFVKIHSYLAKVKLIAKNKGAPIYGTRRSYHIISYHIIHIVHFSGASSKTQAPQPLNKQVSFQQLAHVTRFA